MYTYKQQDMEIWIHFRSIVKGYGSFKHWNLVTNKHTARLINPNNHLSAFPSNKNALVKLCVLINWLDRNSLEVAGRLALGPLAWLRTKNGYISPSVQLDTFHRKTMTYCIMLYWRKLQTWKQYWNYILGKSTLDIKLDLCTFKY